VAAVKLGIVGGTFDPLHVGHLVLAEQAREQLGLAQVLWVPSGDPWRKSGRAVSPSRQRLDMVRLAIADNAAFQLCTLEVDRPGPTYSVDTLTALRAQHPEAELVFLVGLDALEDLPRWHRPEQIMQLATLAVAPRGSDRLSREHLERLLPGLADAVVWVEIPRIDVSATDLRRRAAEGRSLRYLVPDAVEAYIREHKLYRRE